MRAVFIIVLLCVIGGLTGLRVAQLSAQFMPRHPSLQTTSAPGVMALGWDTTHYNSACLNLTGTNSTIATGFGGGTDCIVYAVNGQTTGKYYGEIDLTGTVTGETAVGLGNSLSSPTPTNGFLGGDFSTIGLFDDNSVFTQNSNSPPGGHGPTFVTANNICIAVDLTNTTKNVWFANLTLGTGWINGGSPIGNPSTGTSGFQINATGSTITSNPTLFAGDVPPSGVLTIVQNLPCLSDTVYGYGSAYLVGFSPFPGSTATLTAETWDPNRIASTNPNTFSSDKLTVTAGAGATTLRASFGTPGFLSGKYYWQVTVTYTSSAINGGGLGVGNGAASAGLTQYAGVDNNSIGYYGDGSVFIGGGSAPGSPIAAYSSTTAVCVAVDYSNAKIWFQPIGSGQWNNAAIGSQSPNGNVGGLNISAITASGTVAIAPVTTLDVPGDTSVANFSSTPCSGVTGLTGFSTIP